LAPPTSIENLTGCHCGRGRAARGPGGKRPRYSCDNKRLAAISKYLFTNLEGQRLWYLNTAELDRRSLDAATRRQGDRGPRAQQSKVWVFGMYREIPEV